MKRSFISLFFILSAFVLFTSSVAATSGCCSHHKGVSHCDTSVGTYVCNDGTYSPSCGCQYTQNINTYLPANTPTPISLQITATTNYTLNSSTHLYNVMFDWNDVTGSTGYSVG